MRPLEIRVRLDVFAWKFHNDGMDEPTPSTRMTCPTCSRRFLLDETETPPFCSERCQMGDLGRWLDERHGLPYEGDPGESPVEYRDED